MMNDVVKVGQRPALTVGILVQQSRQNLRRGRKIRIIAVRVLDSGPVGLRQKILGLHGRLPSAMAKGRQR
ncbi:hypothetical protein [Actinoplanes regularis]|uniref:hypothetical protein n=1 Tax=Actinoplanes regularis TaxID=52697 RepID=UPI002556A8D3|nr:hypothetical protein [Actinoplanes regularis]